MRVAGGNESDQALDFLSLGLLNSGAYPYNNRCKYLVSTGKYWYVQTSSTRTAVAFASVNHFHPAAVNMSPVCRNSNPNDQMLLKTWSSSFSVQDRRIKVETASTGVSCDKCCTPEHGNVNDCDGHGTTPHCQNRTLRVLIAYRPWFHGTVRKKNLPLQIRHHQVIA